MVNAIKKNHRAEAVLCAVAAGVMLVLGGCGGTAGPERYEVSGKATFNGQPISAGKIMFLPEPTAENKGARGIAKIENGQYKTLPGEGAVAGPQVVQIQGFDGVRPPGWTGSDFGTPIFNRYETKVDLPARPTTVDLDVPLKR